MTKELVYLSQPARLGGVGHEEYREFVIGELTDAGYNVIHPFEAFPYERFEGNPNVGRELAMRYCCELIDACRGGVALTGISEGTLIETDYLLLQHPDRNLHTFQRFDDEWQANIDKFSGDPRFSSFIGKLAVPIGLETTADYQR